MNEEVADRTQETVESVVTASDVLYLRPAFVGSNGVMTEAGFAPELLEASPSGEVAQLVRASDS